MASFLAYLSVLLFAVAAADQACHRHLDVVYVVDSSGSIGHHNWQLVKRFFSDLTMRLDISPSQMRVGGVVFGHTARAQWSLTDYTSQEGVLKAISGLDYMKSTTNTAHGLEVARAMFAKAPRREEGAGRLVILMTDGAPTVRASDTLTAAESLKKDGATILTLGITRWVDQVILKEMASADPVTGDPMYIHAADFNQLTSQVLPILSLVCTDTAGPTNTVSSRPQEPDTQPQIGGKIPSKPATDVSSNPTHNNASTHHESSSSVTEGTCGACRRSKVMVKETIVQALYYEVTVNCDGSSSCAKLVDSKTTKSTEFDGTRPGSDARQDAGAAPTSDAAWWKAVEACTC